MKTMKRFFALLVFVLMLCGLLPVFSTPVHAAGSLSRIFITFLQ